MKNYLITFFVLLALFPKPATNEEEIYIFEGNYFPLLSLLDLKKTTYTVNGEIKTKRNDLCYIDICPLRHKGDIVVPNFIKLYEEYLSYLFSKKYKNNIYLNIIKLSIDITDYNLIGHFMVRAINEPYAELYYASITYKVKILNDKNNVVFEKTYKGNEIIELRANIQYKNKEIYGGRSTYSNYFAFSNYIATRAIKDSFNKLNFDPELYTNIDFFDYKKGNNIKAQMVFKDIKFYFYSYDAAFKKLAIFDIIDYSYKKRQDIEIADKLKSKLNEDKLIKEGTKLLKNNYIHDLKITKEGESLNCKIYLKFIRIPSKTDNENVDQIIIYLESETYSDGFIYRYNFSSDNMVSLNDVETYNNKLQKELVNLMAKNIFALYLIENGIE